MIKNVLIFVGALLLFQNAKAQRDTTVYYLKKSGDTVACRAGADYIRLVMPPDSSSGVKLYPVEEFYPNGSIRMTGNSKDNSRYLNLEGESVNFYPNGNKSSISVTSNHRITAQTVFYPNGQLASVKKYTQNGALYIECRDSTGKILTENGNGTWIQFDEHFKNIIAEGTIADSLEDGEWHGKTADSGRYDCLYVKGKPTTGTGYDKNGQAHPFTNFEIEPQFKGGMQAFYRFITKTVRYPYPDFKSKTQGRVIVQFLIGADGSVSNAKVLRAPSETLGNEALRVINLLPPWVPGMQYGMPVKVVYTVPINFSLDN